MARVSLLNSNKMCELLRDALEWKGTVSSLMVSAMNGSILAYAFREETPSIKDLRSMSATMTTAYSVASEDVLVFEAQVSRALSVVVPIADHVLLAVKGPDVQQPPAAQHENGLNGGLDEPRLNFLSMPADRAEEADDPTESGVEQEHVRADLDEVSEELAAILRKEFLGMNWPEEI